MSEEVFAIVIISALFHILLCIFHTATTKTGKMQTEQTCGCFYCQQLPSCVCVCEVMPPLWLEQC